MAIRTSVQSGINKHDVDNGTPIGKHPFQEDNSSGQASVGWYYESGALKSKVDNNADFGDDVYKAAYTSGKRITRKSL